MAIYDSNHLDREMTFTLGSCQVPFALGFGLDIFLSFAVGK